MFSLLAEIERTKLYAIGMLAVGVMQLLFCLLGWSLGGMPAGGRYSHYTVVREIEPDRFWSMLIRNAIVGVGLLAAGAYVFLFGF